MAISHQEILITPTEVLTGGVYMCAFVCVKGDELPLELQIVHLLAKCLDPALQFANNKAFVPRKQMPRFMSCSQKAPIDISIPCESAAERDIEKRLFT